MMMTHFFGMNEALAAGLEIWNAVVAVDWRTTFAHQSTTWTV
jgi:hypothetical protein